MRSPLSLRQPLQLPHLKGKWLALYILLWAIALPLAVAGPARGVYNQSQWRLAPVWHPHGIMYIESSRGPVIRAVTTKEARQAAIRHGDLIIAIDGWSLPRTPDASVIARDRLRKPDGSATTFTLQSPGEAPRDVRLTKSLAHLNEVYEEAGISRSFETFAVLAKGVFTPLLLVPASLLLFVRRRHEAVPAMISLAFLIICATDFGADWLSWGISRAITGPASAVGWCLLFGALLAFPSGRFEPGWTAVAFAVVSLAVITRSVVDVDVNQYNTAALLGLSATAVLIVRFRRIPPGPERQQLRWVFFGFFSGACLILIAAIGSSIEEIVVSTDPRWHVWLNAVFAPLVPAGLGLMAFGIIISILRFRLYDAEAVIGTSAVFGVLTVGFVGVFAASEKLVELVGEQYFGRQLGVAGGAIGAAAAAVLIVPLHRKVHAWAERHFQTALTRLRRGLPDCVSDLRETGSVAHLLETIITQTRAGVRSSHGAILLAAGGKWQVAATQAVSKKQIAAWRRGWTPRTGIALDCDRDDPLFPIRARLMVETGGASDMIGWLLLGPRPDGTFYGKAEREAIVEIAEPVARAVQVALRREERESRYERRIEALEKLLEQSTGRRKPAPAG